MKAKIIRGRGFRGVGNYIRNLGRHSVLGKTVEPLCGNIDMHASVSEQAKELRAVANLRPDIKRPVLHIPISATAGEKLSRKQWSEFITDFLAGMGLDPRNHQYGAWRHSDTEYDHAHLWINRVGLNGVVWLGQFEAERAIKVTQELEIKHGLVQTKGLDPGRKRPRRKQPKSGAIGRARRTGEVPVSIRLQVAIDAAIQATRQSHGGLQMFVDHLAMNGVRVLPNGKTGGVSGVSFMLDGIPAKGSDLGDDYKWSSIRKIVSYDQARDAELIARLRAAAPAPVPKPTPTPKPPTRHETAALIAVTSIHRRPAPRRKNGSFAESGSSTERRQHFKLKLLQQQYQQQLDDELRDRLRRIRLADNRIVIDLEPGGRVIDRGDLISCDSGSRDEISAMLAIAKAKGWRGIELRGSADFIERAALSAMRAGFPIDRVTAKDSAHAGAIERARKRFAAERAALTSQETPPHGHDQRNAQKGARGANPVAATSITPATSSGRRIDNQTTAPPDGTVRRTGTPANQTGLGSSRDRVPKRPTVVDRAGSRRADGGDDRRAAHDHVAAGIDREEQRRATLARGITPQQQRRLGIGEASRQIIEAMGRGEPPAVAIERLIRDMPPNWSDRQYVESALNQLGAHAPGAAQDPAATRRWLAEGVAAWSRRPELADRIANSPNDRATAEAITRAVADGSADGTRTTDIKFRVRHREGE